MASSCRRWNAGTAGALLCQRAIGLCMYPIYTFGSEEQKQRWLPAMATGEKLGCFGLTEPDAGSNPGAMRTRARREAAEYVLNGEKMWITSGSIADVAVIWAKNEEQGGKVRGFLVETDRPGFSAKDVHGKWSLRASVHLSLSLQDVRIPSENLLPKADGLKSALMCLNQARYGIAWGVMARPWRATTRRCSTRSSASSSMTSRSHRHQLVQEKLVWMISEISKAQLFALQVGRLKDQEKPVTSTSPWPSGITSGWPWSARAWRATFLAQTASPTNTRSSATWRIWNRSRPTKELTTSTP